MVKIVDMSEATARVEAALYSAGRPLSEDELVRASGTESRTKTNGILRSIMQKTRTAFKAIEVVTLPDGSYVLQLKPGYNSTVKRYASKPVLPKATLKTLSYVALEQPVSSKHLADIRGTGVYTHLKELRRLDYIQYESAGRIKIYSTTEKFQKYFGIQGDVDELRTILFSKTKKPVTSAANRPVGGNAPSSATTN